MGLSFLRSTGPWLFEKCGDCGQIQVGGNNNRTWRSNNDPSYNLRVEDKDMLGQKTRHWILMAGRTWHFLARPHALLLLGDSFTWESLTAAGDEPTTETLKSPVDHPTCKKKNSPALTRSSVKIFTGD